ncbi:MAG: methyl-accepting chemotaxis protein, partial [Pseudomonadota bacterium]
MAGFWRSAAARKDEDAPQAQPTANDDYGILRQMVDAMPINVMMCDPQTLDITFINARSIETLKTLQEHLPDDVDPNDMMNQCIDIFHKNPEHQ